MALGRTRDQAAQVFGSTLDQFRVTTFEEFESLTAGQLPGFIGIAAGPGADQAMRHALELRSTRPDLTIALEIPTSSAVGLPLLEMLADTQAPVSGVQSFGNRPCLVVAGGQAATPPEPWVLPALFSAASAAENAARSQQDQLAAQWEADAHQATARRLDLALSQTTADLARARARVRNLKHRARRRTLTADVEYELADGHDGGTDRPAGRRVRRFLSTATGLGARTRRGKMVVLAVATAAALVALVGVPVVLGLVAGETAALVGVAGGAVLLALGLSAALLLVSLRVLHAAAVGSRTEAELTLRQNEMVRASLDTHEELLRRQLMAIDKLPTTAGATAEEVARASERTYESVQAAANLFELVPPRAAVPPMSHWAASPDLVLWAVDTLVQQRPAVVVECGSGISTLFLALAAEKYGIDTRIVALEHDRRYARRTRELLEHHGVAGRAEVRHAPLARTSLTEHNPPWFEELAVSDLTDIGFLLVDGPPASTGPHARYPAIPILQSRLAKVCTILVDDLLRDENQETTERWQPMLPDFQYDVLPLHKGAAVFRRF